MTYCQWSSASFALLADEEHNSFLLVSGMDGNGVKGDIMAYQEDTNTFEILPGKLGIPRRDFAATAIFDNQSYWNW